MREPAAGMEVQCSLEIQNGFPEVGGKADLRNPRLLQPQPPRPRQTRWVAEACLAVREAHVLLSGSNFMSQGQEHAPRCQVLPE